MKHNDEMSCALRRHPVARILELSFSKYQKTCRSKTKLLLLLESIGFKQFTNSEIQDIERMLEDGSLLQTIDRKYRFGFPLFVNELSEIAMSDAECSPVVTFFVLQSCIAFLLTIENELTAVDSLDVILSCLVRALEDRELKELVVDTFVYVVSATTRKSVELKFDKIFPSLVDFFHSVTRFDEEFTDMLIKLLRSLVSAAKGDMTKDVCDLLGLLNQLVHENPECWTCDNSADILEMFVGRLMLLDPHVLVFLNQMGDLLHVSQLSEFVCLFPEFLAAFISDSEVFNEFPKLEGEPYVVQLPNEAGFNLGFFDEKILPSDVSNCSVFQPDSVELIDLFPEQPGTRISLLGSVVGFCGKSMELLPTCFTKVISENEASEHFLDMCIGTLIVCQCVHGNEMTPLILQMYHSRLFDDRVSMFKDNLTDAERHVLVVRSHLFRLMITEIPVCLEESFAHRSSSPLAVAELCAFLNSGLGSFSTDLLGSVHFSRLLSNIYDGYRYIAYRQDPVAKEVLIVRNQFLSLIVNIMQNEQMWDCWYESSFLSALILSNLYERPLRALFLKTLTDVWTRNPPNGSSMVIQYLLGIFASFGTRNGDERYLQLMGDLLLVMTSVLSLNPQMLDVFVDFYEIVCGCLPVLVTGTVARYGLKMIIEFFTSLTPRKVLSKPVIESLYASIVAVDSDEPSEEISGMVLRLLTGDTSPARETLHIRQPQAVSLYLKIHQRSTKLSTAIESLDLICRFSMENTMLCHEGELDLQLLDVIEEHKQDDRGDIIDPSLNLLMRIASHISSTQVLLKYIELFCPIHCKFVSRWHRRFVQTLTNIVISRNRVPKGSIPIKKNAPHILVSGINSTKLTQGFSVIMWLYMDVGISESKMIAMVADSRGRFLNIWLNPSSVTVELGTAPDKAKDTCIFPVSFPRDSWFLVTVSYLNIGGKSTISASADLWFSKSEPVGQIEFDKTVRFLFGNLEEGNEYAGEMGPVGVITNNAISSLPEAVYAGPRYPPPLEYVFFIDMSLVNNTVTIHPKDKSTNCQAKLIGQKVVHGYSIVEILVRFFKVQVILPLFAQLDLRFVGGEETESMVLDIFDLLFATLKIMKECQADFSQSSGFRIVSHLLRKSNPKHLTVDLYTKILKMHDGIASQRLKLEIFNSLLMNFDLWVHADPETQLTVVQSWSTSLLTKCREMIVRHRPFRYLLAALRIFYYYDPLEINFICADRPAWIPIEEIRTAVEPLLCSEYDELDLVSLIGHIVSCSDTKNVLYLLRFVQRACEQGRLKQSKHFRCLDLLVRSRSEDVILECFRTVVVLHQHKCYKKLSLFVHVSHLTKDINFYAFRESPTFIPSLLSLAAEFPVFISACFRAVVDGGDYHHFFAHLKPEKQYCLTKTWMFWPIVAALRVGEAFQAFVMDFVVLSHDGDWWDIFAMIVIVAKALFIDASDCLCVFLKLLGNSLLCRNDVNTVGEAYKQFFAMSEVFLLFRPLSYVNAALDNVYHESPFGDCEAEESKQDSDANERLELSEFFLQVQRTVDITEPIRFGLRFDKYGEWIDADLAIVYIRLALKSTAPEIHNIAALLCSYAIHDRKAVTTPYIDALFKAGMLSESLMGHLKNGQDLGYDYFGQLTKTNTAVMNALSKVETSIRLAIDALCNPKANQIKLDIIKYSLQQMEICRDRICNSQFQNNKEWHRLWEQLTFDLAPWSKTVAVQRSTHYWKRDNCLCGVGFPAKLKVNINHNDHRYASFRRDTGSRTVAESMLADYRRQHSGEGITSELLQLSNAKNREEVSLPSSHRPKVDIQAWLITVKQSRKCKFMIIGKDIHIMIGTAKDIMIKYEEIGRIAYRPIHHRPTGLEIFLKIGRSYLLNMPHYNSWSILKALPDVASFAKSMIQTSKPVECLKNKNLVQKWVNGEISNFEYLLALNDISGRSYHDGSMYPVMPWVLQDYTSETLDLADPTVFRDLSKPMGAMTEKRLAGLQKKMDELRECGSGSDAYLYGSGYIAPLTLFTWLIRMEPFTTLHIDAQSGKFDHASRIFSSIEASFRMATQNSNDYVELIPEFYCNPSFLANLNDLDLGVINHKKIGDVELPKWAHTPMEFVYKMREALESEYVSEHLCEWIDLIWGSRQTNDPVNTFHPYMYASAWTKETEKDPAKVAAIEAIMKECGQIPVQLFTSPHPKRDVTPRKSPITAPIKVHCGVPVLCAWLRDVTKHELEFFIVHDDSRTVSRVAVGFTGSPSVTKKNLALKIDEVNTIFIYDKSLITTSITGEIDIVDLVTMEPVHFAAHIGPVNCMAADENYLVTGGSDTATNVYFNNKIFTLSFAVPSYRGSVRACAVSSPFAVVVSGTADGSILIFSITSHAIVHVLKTDSRIPEKILVSEEWGFVIVYETEVKMGQVSRYIEVFTIDGILVGRKQVQFTVTAWCTMSNGSGRDYVALSDHRGRMYLFEAFYLDIGEPFHRTVENITHMVYVDSIMSISAVSSSGVCFIVPIQMK